MHSVTYGPQKGWKHPPGRPKTTWLWIVEFKTIAARSWKQLHCSAGHANDVANDEDDDDGGCCGA